MNHEKDKELDDFFRKGLQNPVDPVFRENDWGSLEQMLKKSRKPKGIVYWLPYISSAAALLLLFLGWWSFRPKPAAQSETQIAVLPHKAAGHGSPLASNQQLAPRNQSASHLTVQGQIAKATAAPNTGKDKPFSARAHGGLPGLAVKNALHSYTDNQLIALAQMKKGSDGPAPVNREFAMLSIASPKINFEDELVNQPVVSGNLSRGQDAGLPGQKPANKTKISLRSAFRPQYALTVLAAPDLNGVGSFQQSKVGTNVGLQFSAGLSRKFSITTGVIYSAKPYLTDFDSYHTLYKFPVTPVNVTADCRMLDIPLNIGYQVYNKHQNRISIGTGLSSYLMLHENYTFNYAASTHSYGYGYTSPTNYTVPNSKSYLMGVFNLNATYERPISSKIDIAVEPYLKLPLTNIGYSQVRLQSTGVAVGLKWNLNSLAKP